MLDFETHPRGTVERLILALQQIKESAAGNGEDCSYIIAKEALSTEHGRGEDVDKGLSAEIMNHPPDWDCPDCGQHFSGTAHACEPTATDTEAKL